jgi:heavy-metal exporter, HME family
LGVAYIVSILASLVVSITVTPVLAYYLLSNTRGHDGDGVIVRVLKRANAAVLGWAFDHAGLLISSVAAAVVAAGITVVGLPRALLPPFNEGTLTISALFQPGISLSESNRLGLIAERLIRDVPEVVSVGRRTGRAELDEHAEGVHSSEIDVDLKPSARPKSDVLVDLRTRLAALPMSINIGQPISHRLDHILSGVRAEIALKVYGDDIDTLRTLAEQFREKLSAVGGLVDLQIEKQVRIPQLRVAVNFERIALYGITPSAITEALEGLSNGRVVSQIIQGNRRFDVVVRLKDADRSTEGLTRLLIATPGGHIPLGGNSGRGRWSQSDPARKYATAHRRARQH